MRVVTITAGLVVSIGYSELLYYTITMSPALFLLSLIGGKHDEYDEANGPRSRFPQINGSTLYDATLSTVYGVLVMYITLNSQKHDR